MTPLQKLIEQRLAKLPPGTDAFRVSDGTPWPGVFIDALADRLLVSLRDTALPPALKDMLKAKMTEENTERMTVDIYEVRWTTVKSDRIDTTAFKKAMPDVAQQFVKTTTSRRFSIA